MCAIRLKFFTNYTVWQILPWILPPQKKKVKLHNLYKRILYLASLIKFCIFCL